MLMKEANGRFRMAWPGNWHRDDCVEGYHWKLWCMGGEL